MRKLLTFTLAVMLAALSTSALAGGPYGHYGHYDNDDNDAAYLAGGLLLGLAAGAAIANNDDGYRYYGGYGYPPPRPFRGAYYYGGGYYNAGYRPYYGPDVVVYRAPPRYRHGGYYYAPPRRVVYPARPYYRHGYRRW